MSGSENGHQDNGHATSGNGYRVPTGRADWIVKRKAEAARTGDTNMSQMHFARKGLITEEMAYIALKEKISPELIRSEVAKGTMIIPANIMHPELEPMAIGVGSLCKINANIGNSQVHGDETTELEVLAADNVKRVVRAGSEQSPWEISAFLELKTVWHPVGS